MEWFDEVLHERKWELGIGLQFSSPIINHQIPLFPIVTGTGTGPLLIKIDGGNNLSLKITLRENNTNALIIVCDAFNCIGGTGPIVHIRFPVIDFASFHNFFHFLFCDLSALHSAARMLRILNEGGPPIKSTIAIYLLARSSLIIAVVI